jgi:hypothetical protein
MKTTVIGTQDLNFFFRPSTPESIPVADTTKDYSFFLSDSLNQKLPDSTFRFELKTIVLPDTVTSAETKKTVKPDRQSVFSPLNKKTGEITPTARYAENYDWLTALFMVCLILIAWIRYYYSRRIKQLFRAVISRHNVNQLIRDGNLAEERLTPALALIYLSSLSVVIWQYGHSQLSGLLNLPRQWMPFLVIVVTISLLWVLKLLVIRLTGYIFRTRQDISELILTNLIFSGLSGLITLPFVIAGFYSGNMLLLKIAGIIILLFIMLRFIRSLLVGLSAQTFSAVYLFLYLCTLEILPLLFLYRFSLVIN